MFFLSILSNKLRGYLKINQNQITPHKNTPLRLCKELFYPVVPRGIPRSPVGRARPRCASLPSGAGHSHRGIQWEGAQSSPGNRLANGPAGRGSGGSRESRPDRDPRRAHLQSTDGSALEAQICLEVLSNFTHQTLEGEFADQKFGGLLIAPDFTQSHSTRPMNIKHNGKNQKISIENIFCTTIKIGIHPPD